MPSLRVCVSAGEALPDCHAATLEVKPAGIEMLDGIGCHRDVPHLLFLRHLSSCAQITGSIGQVVPGYEACVLDEQGATLAPWQMGRLAVRGPTGCKYLDDARQATYVQHGWNFPGDVVFQDADGYFHYQSRADDMIISAGYNIAGPEVEDALLKHPSCFGMRCGGQARLRAGHGGASLLCVEHLASSPTKTIVENSCKTM